jgi:Peptidase family M28
MRLVLILLLLAACAPIGASEKPPDTGQYPNAQSQDPSGASANPTGQIPGAVSGTPNPNIEIPTTGSENPNSKPQTPTPAGSIPPSNSRPTSEPSVEPTGSPAIQPSDQVSVSRLRANLLVLQGFHTRHSASAIGEPAGEIGTARTWLINQLRGISPRMQVETDSFVFSFGNRPVAAQNIIATLPGRANPPPVIIISAHYDSRTVDISDLRSAAPGANDDGSGVAAVLELARVLSSQTLDATYKFILFAGEEEGLFGSEHLASIMRKDGVHIIAMLNNDIIGNVTGSDGRRVDNRVRIFSGDPDAGPSRQLARDAKRIVESSMPGFGVELVAALDRAGRGGDHIPFHYAGFPAIRFIEAVENLEHQHSANDRVEFMDMAYLANVVRANLAVALELGRTIRG